MSTLSDPRRRFTVVASVCVAIILAVSGLILYWAAFDAKMPIRDLRGRFIERNDEQGLAVVEWSGIRQRNCPGIARRWLVDGFVVALAPHALPYASPEEIGKPVTWQTWVEIPAHLDAPIRYQIEHEYYCNPIQRLFNPLLSHPAPVPLKYEEGGKVELEDAYRVGKRSLPTGSTLPVP